jgi:oligopeptide/dipeptide ABC transporter ATP-binding protein
MSEPLLKVRGLKIGATAYPPGEKPHDIEIVHGVDFDVQKGKVLGLIGESGAGKSTIGLASMAYGRGGVKITGGEVWVNGRDIMQSSLGDIRKLRGGEVTYVSQSAAASFNPAKKIIDQVVEAAVEQNKFSRKEAEERARVLFEKLGLPDPDNIGDRFPHQVSGGQLQRCMTALALCPEPDLVVFDEPTTALDVTIQADIMELLLELCDSNKVGLILITHDLGVVSQMTERTLVMYAGRIIEAGRTREIINDPQHPYTQGLINALPQQTKPGQRLKQIPGNMPSLTSIPKGCPFSPRCEYVQDHCRTEAPKPVQYTHVQVACHEVNRLHSDKAEEMN